MTSSVLQDDTIYGSIIDPINGGGDTNLFADFFN